MLRLTESTAADPLEAKSTPDTRLPRSLAFDSAQIAEQALNHAERRMENLRELVRRFDLDAPGEGPRVA